jgi:hypothetical protein
MTGEVVPHSGGGGDLVVVAGDQPIVPSTTGAPTGDLGAQDLAPITDAEHFEDFGQVVRATFSSVGITDTALSQKVVQVAEAFHAAMPAKGMTEAKAAADFAQRLVRAGVNDARSIGVAVTAGLRCVDELRALDQGRQDLADFRQAREALQKAWGAGYAANVSAVRAFIKAKLPPPLADALIGEGSRGRDAEGRLLANSPQVLEWLLGLATGSSAPGGGREALEAERRKIEETRRTKPRDYWRDPAMRQRYLELLDLLGVK